MNFSVLMSVYKNDNAKHFRLALESISVNQTVKPSQIVIVQDGAVDPCIESIIEKISLQETQIEFTVLKKSKNQGLAAALNDGIELCKYDYIARMDADDIAVPNRFKLQTDALKENPRIDILGGYIVEFQDDPTKLGKIRRVGESHNDIVNMARHRCPFNHMTVMYKKEMVKAAGKYKTDFGKLEDYKLWVDMIAIGCRCANLPEILILMRTGNGMIQRRSDPKEIKDWDRLQDDLIASHIISSLEALLNRLYIRLFTYMPSSMKTIVYKLFLRK